MTSEKKLIKACIAGKKRAQSELFNNYASKMLGVCIRYMGDSSRAEDVLQEGFIKVFKNIRKFRAEGKIESWIRRIMVNTAISQIKKDRKYQFEEFDDSHVIANEDKDEEIVMPDPETVIALFDHLPTGYRTVLNLYAVDGYSHRRIADELGISVNTSKSQLSKARRMLKRLIKSMNENTMNE